MPDTRLRSPQAIELLKRDHDEVRGLIRDYQALFSDYDELGEETLQGRREVLNALKEELTLHAELEEEWFYPAIFAIDGETNAVELVLSARAEHRLVRTLLEELSGLDPGSEAFKAKMRALVRNVDHHLDEEEDKIFPLFGTLNAEKQAEISQAIWQKHLDRSGSGDLPDRGAP